MNTQQITTDKQILQVPWITEPEIVEAKRDSDGRWLKRNVKLATAPKAQSKANMTLAAKFNVDADELFA